MFLLLCQLALGAVPDTAEALAAAEAFQAWALEDPTPESVSEHLRLPELPAGPSSEFREQVVASLGPEGALGRLLRSSRPELAVQGPDYARVVFGSEPPLSLIVRERDGAIGVDELALTSCRLCDEPSRAVRDLLARSAAGEAVLWPHQDLSVTRATEERQLPTHRVAALQKRAVLRELAADLATVEVLASEAEGVRVAVGEAEELWPLVYEQGQWRIDYAGLPDDSVLRLSRRDADDFRPKYKRSASLLKAYEPDSGRVPGGRRLTTRAVGAVFDPRDSTVITAILDVDRALAGLVRLDPATGDILDRWQTRPAPRMPIDLDAWFDTWHLALSPDGHRAALSTPGQIDVVDLVSGKRSLVFAFDEASHLAWVDTTEGDVLVIGQRTAVHLVHGTSHHSAAVDGPTVGAFGSGDGVGLLTESGTLFHYDLGRRGMVEERAVCCGGARGVAASESRGELLVTCPQTCELAGERRAYRGEGSTELLGAGTRGEGVAYSPDGTLFATAAMGDGEGVLLWNAYGEPIGAAGEGQARSLSFDPRGEMLLAVTTDGEVHLFSVAELRRRGLEEP